jgi:hypothetical protein
MRTLLTDLVQTYDGRQLRSDWIREGFGLDPDAIVVFRGACAVKPEYMVDTEDLEKGRTIVARDMLHFIAEHADGDLQRAVLRQRLLVVCAHEVLDAGRSGQGNRIAAQGQTLTLRRVERLHREGDDLFVGEGERRRKLSVSVATRSRKGTSLIHLGINIDPSGAPVPAVGLKELGVDPRSLAEDVLLRYAVETAAAEHAASKVREAP